MKVRKTVENPDSQFVAMPQTITPAGIELKSYNRTYWGTRKNYWKSNLIKAIT